MLDLQDLKKVLQYNAIMRKIIELEQQGAEEFFGERSLR